MIPKLRLRGFSGAWQTKSLKSISKKVSERNKSINSDTILTNSAVRGVILQTDFFDKEIAVQGNLENYFKVAKDDFIYNPRISASAPVGPFKRNHYGGGVMSPLYTIFRFNSNENLGFFEQFFTTSKWHRYMKSIANYGARHDRMAISTTDLESLPLPYPDPKEQEKIAGFLGAVDDKISGLEKKKELLEKYKKGVMQKIFTRQIRFKDKNGKNYPVWQEKKVIDVYHFRSTNSLSRECLSDVGKYKNIHYGDIHKKYSMQLDTIEEDIPRIYKAPKVLIEKFIPESILKEKDIIMADASEDYKDIGKSLEIINTEGVTVAGLHTIVMRPYDADNLALGFGSYLFNSQQVHSQVIRLATGVSVLGISLSNLMNVKIAMPSFEEQQKIADFLTVLDDKIELENKKLQQAKLFKKSLLQKMFV